MITIKKAQVITVKGSWVTYQDKDGKVLKARKSKVTITQGNSIEFRRIGDVRYNCKSYVKVVTPAGNFSLNNGDDVARKLAKCESIEEVYKAAAKALGAPVSELKAKYSHLNAGMQRMNLGNRIRSASAA